MSIHRCRITGTTKLERIGRRATMNKSGVFHNIVHAIDSKLLQKQYLKLKGNKAVGIDGVTKAKYGMNLKENINDLVKRIKQGTYIPQPSRVVEIPKADGGKRPLAISCLEDKLVQSAVNEILGQIYEPIFLDCSYGSRPLKNCHMALKSLMRYTYKMPDGAVVEIDIQKYFNSIPHEDLMKFLDIKIKDEFFKRLLRKLIKAPTIVDGKIIDNSLGCPQGSICSPLLANIYLHYVIDEWVAKTVRKHIRGRVEMVRYVDDMVFAFSNKSDAHKFYGVLAKRFERFGLKLHVEKSQLLESGRVAAARADKRGEKLPVYQFLGFICYWGKARNGFYRLKYKSRGDRFRAKLKGLKEYLRKNLNAKSTHGVIKLLCKMVRGWINYHAISDNDKCVKAFVHHCKHILFKWMNRRGRRLRLNWEKFIRTLKFNDYPERWKTTSMFQS